MRADGLRYESGSFRSLVGRMFGLMGTNKLFGVAAGIFVVIVFCAVFGELVVPYSPVETSADTLQPPSLAHLFGTDHLGRDIFSRTVAAARIDLGVALSAVSLSFVIGTVLGMSAGFFGSWIDRIIGRMTDTIMAFPLFILAMAIVAALGNTIWNIVIATAIINIPFYIRFSRAEVNRLRTAGFVEAARVSGNGSLRILGAHLFPNILPPMIVQLSLNMGWAILNAAGLSFIGLGVRPPTPEWGILVSEGASFIISGEWWIFMFPGTVLIAAVFSFNVLGDGFRDLFDVKGR